MKPRDRCPRLFCFGTLHVTQWTPIFWRAKCQSCGRVARLDENFEWVDRPSWLAWGVGLFWLVLVVGGLWLQAVIT